MLSKRGRQDVWSVVYSLSAVWWFARRIWDYHSLAAPLANCTYKVNSLDGSFCSFYFSQSRLLTICFSFFHLTILPAGSLIRGNNNITNSMLSLWMNSCRVLSTNSQRSYRILLENSVKSRSCQWRVRGLNEEGKLTHTKIGCLLIAVLLPKRSWTIRAVVNRIDKERTLTRNSWILQPAKGIKVCTNLQWSNAGVLLG